MGIVNGQPRRYDNTVWRVIKCGYGLMIIMLCDQQLRILDGWTGRLRFVYKRRENMLIFRCVDWGGGHKDGGKV